MNVLKTNTSLTYCTCRAAAKNVKLTSIYQNSLTFNYILENIIQEVPLTEVYVIEQNS